MEVIDAYVAMKTGGKKQQPGRRRFNPMDNVDPALPPHLQQAVARESAKEGRKQSSVHLSTLPLGLQQAVAGLRKRAKVD